MWDFSMRRAIGTNLGVVYSDDYGATWHDPKPIITDKKPKPAEPDWTGLGDGCVIWDEANSRYICYYQGKVSTGANALCMASSSDRTGASGTWKKWDGSDFTLPAYDSSTDFLHTTVPQISVGRISLCQVFWTYREPIRP